MKFDFRLVRNAYGMGLRIGVDERGTEYTMCLDGTKFTLVTKGETTSTYSATPMFWEDYEYSVRNSADKGAVLRSDLYIFLKFIQVAAKCPAVVKIMTGTAEAPKLEFVEMFKYFMEDNDITIRTPASEILRYVNTNTEYNTISSSDEVLRFYVHLRGTDYVMARVQLSANNNIAVEYWNTSSSRRTAAIVKLPISLMGFVDDSELFYSDFNCSRASKADVLADIISCVLSMVGVHINSEGVKADDASDLMLTCDISGRANIVQNYTDILRFIVDEMDKDLISKLSPLRIGKIIQINGKPLLCFNTKNKDHSERIGFESYQLLAYIDGDPAVGVGNGFKGMFNSTLAYRKYGNDKVFGDTVMWLHFLSNLSLLDDAYSVYLSDNRHVWRFIELFKSFMETVGWHVALEDYTLATMVEPKMSGSQLEVPIGDSDLFELSMLADDAESELCGIQVTNNFVYVYTNNHDDSDSNKYDSAYHCMINENFREIHLHTNAVNNGTAGTYWYYILRGVMASVGIRISDDAGHYEKVIEGKRCTVFDKNSNRKLVVLDDSLFDVCYKK